MKLEVTDLQVWLSLPSGRLLHAVRGVSFTLSAGERLGLVGESGSGKTTTILALMGLLPSNAWLSGRVLLDGEDILERGEESVRSHRWTDISMVFQGAMNSFNPVTTIGSQIVEAIGRRPVPNRKPEAYAGELLELVGLRADCLRSYPHQLSGGMRQRAAIAMALACGPKILLADEPTTALDVMVQAQILDLLGRLSDELNLAVILVTHDLPVVAGTCGRAAVVYAGEIVEIGSPEELYHAPVHPYTRLLFAATPDPFSPSREVSSIPGIPPRLDEPVEGCPFAPRCPLMKEPCTRTRPSLEDIGPGHRAACLRYAELKGARTS